jgi:hypothetical protein
MATQITQGECVLFNSVTGQAFGPLWEDYEEAEDFLSWTAENVIDLEVELSELTPAELERIIAQWCKARSVPEAPARRPADGLRARIQELKAEFAALETVTERGPLSRYAEEGVARERLSRTPTVSMAVDAAVSAYVRDNGDCVPVEVVEGIRHEVDILLNGIDGAL